MFFQSGDTIVWETHKVVLTRVGNSLLLSPFNFDNMKCFEHSKVIKKVFEMIESKSILSECVIIVYVNSAIFQLYHGENNLIFSEMMMRSAL